MNRKQLFASRLGVKPAKPIPTNDVIEHHELVQNAIRAFFHQMEPLKGAGGAKRLGVKECLEIVESLDPRK